MADGLGDLAGALRKAAAGLRDSGARQCAAESGKAYLEVLRGTTPVLTGELRDSERVDEVRGSGTSATAVIGAHTVYAAFRETGGTIVPHDRSRGGWVGAPRIINGHMHGHHTLHWGGEPGVFAMKVTQEGSHYFERAGREAQGPVAAACRKVIDGILRDSGM